MEFYRDDKLKRQLVSVENILRKLIHATGTTTTTLAKFFGKNATNEVKFCADFFVGAELEIMQTDCDDVRRSLLKRETNIRFLSRLIYVPTQRSSITVSSPPLSLSLSCLLYTSMQCRDTPATSSRYRIRQST